MEKNIYSNPALVKKRLSSINTYRQLTFVICLLSAVLLSSSLYAVMPPPSIALRWKQADAVVWVKVEKYSSISKASIVTIKQCFKGTVRVGKKLWLKDPALQQVGQEYIVFLVEADSKFISLKIHRWPTTICLQNGYVSHTTVAGEVRICPSRFAQRMLAASMLEVDAKVDVYALDKIVLYIRLTNPTQQKVLLDLPEAIHGGTFSAEVEKGHNFPEPLPYQGPKPQRKISVSTIRILPGKSYSVEINLSEWFEITEHGKYRVKLQVFGRPEGGVGYWSYAPKLLFFDIKGGLL